MCEGKNLRMIFGNLYFRGAVISIEILKMVLFIIISVIFIVFLIRLHEKIFEHLGIYKLLNKLWKRLQKSCKNIQNKQNETATRWNRKRKEIKSPEAKKQG